MAIVYEVTAATGTYVNKDGEEKKSYARLGVVMETKNGLMLKLETVPVKWEGFAYLNEPKAREDKPQSKPAPVDDSDLPF
jgi:hypothetical protein